jgi:hypothetical protein
MPGLVMEANTSMSTSSAASFDIYEAFVSFMKNEEVLLHSIIIPSYCVSS